jgi:hypothetical protein
VPVGYYNIKDVELSRERHFDELLDFALNSGCA